MTAIDSLVCDRCGGSEQSRYRFCPDCQTFVCSNCWDDEQARCLSCSRPTLPVPGTLPALVRDTIGSRPVFSESTSRVGRALAGPSGEVADGERSAARPAAPQESRRRGWARSLATVATSLDLTAVLFALPTLARVVLDAMEASAPAVSSPATKVTRQVRSPKHVVSRYVVRAGDTLRSIAAEVYGDAERWEAIYRANREAIGDPDALKVGSTLVIPRDPS